MIGSMLGHQQLTSYINKVKDEQAVSKDGELIWSFKNAAGETELTTTKEGSDDSKYTALLTCKFFFSLYNIFERFESTIHALVGGNTANVVRQKQMVTYDALDWHVAI